MKINLTPHPFRRGIFVSADGRIFKELPVSKSTGGYHTTHIDNETIRRHVLVAETFHGRRPPKQGVRHLDGNPANDHPRNLRWGTQKENIQDAIRHGKFPNGERSPHAKLTAKQVTEIKKRRKRGESGKDLAIEFGISQQRVCDLFKGRGWSTEGVKENA